MDKYIYDGDCEVRACDCEFVEGNVSKPIEINKNSKACEIKVDMEVEKRRSIRIWGQIKDSKGNPIRCAMVKLIKEVYFNGRKSYVGVAHGVTDCMGFYQFDICVPEHCQMTEKYRVIVGKQAVGEEFIMGEAECDSFYDENCGCTK